MVMTGIESQIAGLGEPPDILRCLCPALVEARTNDGAAHWSTHALPVSGGPAWRMTWFAEVGNDFTSQAQPDEYGRPRLNATQAFAIRRNVHSVASLALARRS